MRVWRNSNVPVCQSGVPSAILGTRTILCAGPHSSDWSRLLIWRAVMLQRGCKSLSAHHSNRYKLRTSRKPVNPAVRKTASMHGATPWTCSIFIWGYGRVRKASALQADHEGATPSVSTNFPRFCASGPGSSLRGVDRYMTVFQADVAGAIPASGTNFHSRVEEWPSSPAS